MANEDYLISESEIPSNLEPVETAPITPAKGVAPPLPTPGSTPPLFSGSIAPQLQLDSNFSKAKANSSRVPTDSLMPLGVQGNPASNAAVISTSKVIVQSEGSGLVLETNGTENSNQKLLNLVQGSGVTLTPANDGSVTMSATATGDGLTHGETPWESDPAYVILRDEFSPFLATTNSYGDYGWWGINNSTSGGGLSINSTYPNLFAEPNFGVYNMILPQTTSANANGGGSLWWRYSVAPAWENLWPLLDYPGWKMTWVFRLSRQGAGTAGVNPGANAFNVTKMSLYIGLANNISLNTSFNSWGRPGQFYGVRYDTDTTAPSINDSTYWLEAVNNGANNTARVNTQGTNGGTFNTGIVVANDENNWHRLEISYPAVGSMTITLDGVGTTFTVGQFSKSFSVGTPGITVTNGYAVIGVNPAPANPVPGWTNGSKVTMSGWTNGGGSGYTAYNGTFVVQRVDSYDNMFFLAPGAVSGNEGNTTITVSSYAPVYPFVGLFNDTSGTSPNGLSRPLQIDYFSFVWNPALSTAGGTPNSAKSRYW